jgi:predicted dinucleotide-utilizing enzyme
MWPGFVSFRLAFMIHVATYILAGLGVLVMVTCALANPDLIDYFVDTGRAHRLRSPGPAGSVSALSSTLESRASGHRLGALGDRRAA